jgi:hypothetical protein
MRRTAKGNTFMLPAVGDKFVCYIKREPRLAVEEKKQVDTYLSLATLATRQDHLNSCCLSGYQVAHPQIGIHTFARKYATLTSAMVSYSPLKYF